MPFALRAQWFVPVVLAGLSAGCMGRVSPGAGGGSEDDGGSPGTGSSGSSSGSIVGGSSSGSGSGSGSGSSSGAPTSSSSSSGGPSPGDPNCSELAVPDLARVCPDGSSVGGQYVVSNHECVLEFPCPPVSPPPGGGCSQGVACSPGSGCGSASSGAAGNPGCETSCQCDGTGHLQCSVTCSDPCTQGAACTPGSGCASSSPSGVCPDSCTCGPDGTFDCVVCEDAGPPPPVTDPCPGFAVPDICEVCGNGTTECAHAILVAGQCQIEICPGGS